MEGHNLERERETDQYFLIPRLLNDLFLYVCHNVKNKIDCLRTSITNIGGNSKPSLLIFYKKKFLPLKCNAILYLACNKLKFNL